MIICPLESYHLKEIITLSNEVFGQNYLEPSTIYKYLHSNDAIGYVASSEDQHFQAFILMELLNATQLSKKVLAEKDWFLPYFSANDKIMLIQQIAVSPRFQNQGIGAKLIRYVQNIPCSASVYCSIVWKKEKETSLQHILLKNDFHLARTINRYWSNDSISKHYNCAICGPPPCNCAAEVFIKQKDL